MVLDPVEPVELDLLVLDLLVLDAVRCIITYDYYAFHTWMKMYSYFIDYFVLFT